MKPLIRMVASAAALFTSATYARHAEFVCTGDWVGPIEIRAPGAFTEDTPVVLDIPYDGCSYDDEAPVYSSTSTVRRTGNELSVYVYSQAVCFSTGTFAEWTYHRTLGRFPAGTYVVNVHYRDQYEPFDFPPFLTLQTTIEVARGSGIASALPSLSMFSAGLLAATVAIAGLLCIRPRRQKSGDGIA